jgi:hypothetical protein
MHVKIRINSTHLCSHVHTNNTRFGLDLEHHQFYLYIYIDIIKNKKGSFFLIFFFLNLTLPPVERDREDKLKFTLLSYRPKESNQPPIKITLLIYTNLPKFVLLKFYLVYFF